MPELFARPLGPDGEPVGPMRRLGTVEKIVTARNPFLDDLGWDGRPIRTDRPSVPIEVTFPRRSITLGTWVLLLTNAADAPPPVSRGSAWRDGAYAACQHQLTGPPEPPPRPRFPRTAVYPQWFLDLLVLQMQRAYAGHPELFDPTAWLTGDLPTDLTASQLGEQPTRPAIRLYDRNWSYAIDAPGIYAPPRTVARDYPPPAEPCQECVRMADPWRHVGLVVGLRIDRDELVGPRTDFMPHYPNGGHR